MSRKHYVKQSSKPPIATKYHESYVDIVKSLRIMELSEHEIAATLNVCIDTFRSWLTQHDELREAYLEGGLSADAKVMAAMHKMAIGGAKITETKEVIDWESGETEELTTIKEMAPNFHAAKWWLEARSRHIEQEINNAKGSNDQEESQNQVISKKDLQERLAEVRENIIKRIE